MNVDTCEFQAITERIDENERRIAALSRALSGMYEATGRIAPDDLRPGRRRAAPRPRRSRLVADRPFHVITGGAS